MLTAWRVQSVSQIADSIGARVTLTDIHDMLTASLLLQAVAVGVPLAAGVGVGAGLKDDVKGWYKSLNKPDWNPPNWVSAHQSAGSCILRTDSQTHYLLPQTRNHDACMVMLLQVAARPVHYLHADPPSTAKLLPRLTSLCLCQVFGPVWSALYTAMGYSSYLVWKSGGGAVPLTLYGIQLALNLAWSPLFFKQHEIGFALADITGAAWAGSTTISICNSLS